jgi:peptidoglycan/LPS O-acetylase OafA/YrhL
MPDSEFALRLRLFSGEMLLLGVAVLLALVFLGAVVFDLIKRRRRKRRRSFASRERRGLLRGVFNRMRTLRN